MTDHTRPDPILQALSRLPELTPDPQRAANLRARHPARRGGTSAPRPVVTRALLAVFSVVYLAAILVDVLRLRGRG